jgi:hypothetical protein
MYVIDCNDVHARTMSHTQHRCATEGSSHSSNYNNNRDIA